MSDEPGGCAAARAEVAKLRAGIECGDCSACCSSVSSFFVMDGDREIKPTYAECESLCASGCGRYEDRPDECSTWHCAWRDGLTEDSMYPPKLGAYVDCGAECTTSPDVLAIKETLRRENGSCAAARVQVTNVALWAVGGAEVAGTWLRALSIDLWTAGRTPLVVSSGAKGLGVEVVFVFKNGELLGPGAYR